MKTLIIALILLPATSFAGAFCGFAPGGCTQYNSPPSVYEMQQRQYEEQRIRQLEQQVEQQQHQLKFNSITGPNGQRYNCMTVPLGNFSQTTCN
jgi:hypothetical protein